MSGPSNPYVGPRPLQRGEPLYGRSAAVSELFARLQARRIVVLHSPSGAGKSSLVQAGLIPRLEHAKFDVWRPIRVNLDPHALEVPPGTNRYLLSVKLSLEQELPPERRRSPAQLAELDLLAYLETRPRRKQRAARAVVLLFDQFEEVLTCGPRELEARREFFTALGAALDAADHWALFIVREDYLAAFSPYRDRLPTAMSNTFRLDFLGLEGAREAIEQPALAGGRRFEAADELVSELAATHVQQPDGSYLREQGIHVEPVQLQVVCSRLWSALPPELEVIESAHVREYAKVSESLAGYYADAVATIAKASVAVERSLREWIGTKLIVDGVRSQVRQEPERSAGLANELITELRARYLVRSEQRASANWFELSHDRLVEAVTRDNEAWEVEHLHPLQIQAKLWEQGSRPAALLLRAEALPEADAWARDNHESLTAGELEFLRESRLLRARERARRRRLIAFGVAATLASASMAALAHWAREAEGVAREAEADAEAARALAERHAIDLEQRTWALQAQSARNMASHSGERIRGLTLALDAYREGALPPDIRADLDAGIFAVTEALHDSYELSGHAGNIIALSFSPDGQQLASAARDQRVFLWDTLSSAPSEPSYELSLPAAVTELVYSPRPGATELLVVAAGGQALLWRPLDDTQRTERLELGCSISAGSYSLDGALLALGCEDGETVLVSRGGEAEPRWLSTGSAGSEGVRALTFSADAGQLLVLHRAGAGVDVDALVLDVARDEPSVFGVGVRQAALSADGARVVTAAAGGRVALWERSSGALRRELASSLPRLDWLAFSPTGERIAATASGNRVILWASEADPPLELAGHSSPISDAAFSPSGELLATVSFDRSLRLWATDSGQLRAQLDSSNALNRVAFSPMGERIATADNAGDTATMVRLWAAEPSARSTRVVDAQARVAPSISPDGQLAVMPRARDVGLWSTIDGQLLHRLDQPDVRQVSFSPDAGRVLLRSREGWRMWDTHTGAALEPTLPSAIQAVAFTGDNKQLIIADSSGGYPRPWAPGASVQPEESQAERASNVIHKLVSSPRGMFAAAWRKGQFAVWNADGSLAHLCDEEPDLLISDLAFSPSGRWLAVASKRDLLWLYDVDTNERQRLEDVGELRALTFSPAEDQLVVAANLELSLWSLDPVRRVAPIGRYAQPVIALGFAPDGALLSSASPTQLHAWTITIERRRALACELVRHSPAAYRDALGTCP